MERLMKKIICVILLMLISVPIYSAKNNTSISEYGDDPDYMIMMFKVSNIQRNEETGEITFGNIGGINEYEKADTNTYVIDENTHIDENAKKYINFDDFVAGKFPWINMYILKSECWREEGNDNKTIHVAALGGFSSRVVGVGSSSQKSAFERLDEFNIMTKNENGSFRPIDNITRAEMAEIIVRMRGMSKYQSNENFFKDVPGNHWAYNYIEAAKQLSLIDGRGDGTFGPEEDVTYEQAIKMIVALLGYGPKAIERGGYPMGYMDVAKEIGLANQLDFQNTDYLIRENIATVLNLALDIPLMVQVVYGSEPQYEILDGVNGSHQTIIDQWLTE